MAIIDGLARLGLAGLRAQLPFESADIWVRLDDSRELTINALPTDRDRGEFIVLETRQTRGIEVQTGQRSPSVGQALRFHCGELRYYVAGAAPPPFEGLDAFVDAFIIVIECVPPSTGA